MANKTCPSCSQPCGPRTQTCPTCNHQFSTGRTAPTQPTPPSGGQNQLRSVLVPGVGGDRQVVVYPVKLEATDPDTVRQWLVETQDIVNTNGRWYTCEAFRYVATYKYPDSSPALLDTIRQVYAEIWGQEEDSLRRVAREHASRAQLAREAYGAANKKKKVEEVIAEVKAVETEVNDDDILADFGIEKSKPPILPHQ